MPDVLVVDQGVPAVATGSLGGLGLTPRETEIVHHMLRGRTNADIATRLGIGPPTAHKHVEHVFAKLGIGSRLEAVATVPAALGVGAE